MIVARIRKWAKEWGPVAGIVSCIVGVLTFFGFEIRSQSVEAQLAVGQDIRSSGGGTGQEIINNGSGTGAEVTAIAPTGGSAIGSRVIQSGPGNGQRVIQNGPGTGFSSKAISGVSSKSP